MSDTSDMPITITNPEIEAKIAALGKRQIVPASKHAMALAILAAAVSDDRGKPVNKWKGKAEQIGNDLTNAAIKRSRDGRDGRDLPEPAEPPSAKAAAGH